MKGFQNLSASAKPDNGIKEVGKGIVSVKENVGFSSTGTQEELNLLARASAACRTQRLLWLAELLLAAYLTMSPAPHGAEQLHAFPKVVQSGQWKTFSHF